MSIYGPDMPITQGYTDLAQVLCTMNNISESDFSALAVKLFENYQRTFIARNPAAVLPDDRWFTKITSLFRGVDCANPVVDFEGEMVMLSDSAADSIGLPEQNRVIVAGSGLGQTSGDGPEFIDEIAQELHLHKAMLDAEAEAGVKLKDIVNEANLEVYTCFPPVPIAFLLKSGIATNVPELIQAIEQIPLTVSGGMNLGKGAWNNPALNGACHVFEALSSQKPFGVVHGNGGLGYKQGIVIMKRT